MKKVILACSLAILSLAATAFTGKKEKASIPASFYHTFRNAKEVTSELVNGMIRVSFISDNHASFAYYDKDGQMVVSSTQLKVQELPSTLQSALQQNYGSWFVADAYRCSQEGNPDYYVVLEKKGVQMILKSSSKTWKKFSEKETTEK